MVENGISIFNKVFLTSPLSWSDKLATVVSLDLSCSSNSVSLSVCLSHCQEVSCEQEEDNSPASVQS